MKIMHNNKSFTYEIQSFSSKRNNETNKTYDEEIDVVLHLEQNTYKCRNYIGEYKSRTNLNGRYEKIEQAGGGMIRVWRDCICTWSHKVVDCYRISRKIVDIAMSFLDRFLSIHIIDSGDHVTKRLIECAAITALYMSIKISASSEPFPVDSFLDLAGLTRNEVFDMEKTILKYLKWRQKPLEI